jgi:chemotaxis protein histidine kinase CheA
VCRYIVDPQSEGVLLPTRGTEANMHQRKYKISSHVQAFLKQFAQWRSEKQFESAGPWRLLKNSNSKLEVQCNQSDMTGHSMFQAMYILAPDSPVASVSCALPSPTSLVMGAAAAKPASASGGTVPSSKSKAADKSKSGEKVLCTYCGKMFGKQGIRNHIAKCAEQAGVSKGWDQHKHQPIADDEYFDNEDFERFNPPDKGSKRTTFTNVPPPTVSLSAAGGDAPKTPEQLLAVALKELKALKKQQKEALEQQEELVPPSSSDSRSSSNSSPEKKKKSQQKKKSGQSAAELRAKAKSAAAAAAAKAKAKAAAGKRKKNKNKKKQKKEKKNKKQDEDSSCNDDSGNSSDGSGDSPPSSSDDNGHRRRKKQRRKQMPSANPRDAVRKSHKRRNAPTTGGVLDWYIESRTDQAIFEERARASQRMYEMVHIYLRNWLSDFTFGCVGTRGPRCRPSC